MTVGDPRHLVAAGLLRRVSTRRWYPDCCDLPDGHVEHGETSAVALCRELREELGITAVIAGEPFAQVKGEDFRMDVWVIDKWLGEPANLNRDEHDGLAWLNHNEMTALRLADPRLPALFRAAFR